MLLSRCLGAALLWVRNGDFGGQDKSQICPIVIFSVPRSVLDDFPLKWSQNNELLGFYPVQIAEKPIIQISRVSRVWGRILPQGKNFSHWFTFCDVFSSFPLLQNEKILKIAWYINIFGTAGVQIRQFLRMPEYYRQRNTCDLSNRSPEWFLTL